MIIQDTSAEAPLPVEGSSMSEVLSLTHIFTVGIVAAHKTPWAREADTLEHRTVELTAKLVHVWKGSVRQAPDATFRVEIEQRRMGDGMVMGHLGLWSHVVPEPDAGVGYLVMANGTPGVVADAARLMREGSLQRLLSPELAADVRFAKQGEKLFQERLHAQGAPAAGASDAEVEAARALVAFANTHRAEAKDVFGRYLWARVLPSFARSTARPLQEVLSLMTAPDATLGLRGECVGAFDRLVPVLAADRGFLVEAGRAFVTLLLDPSATALRERVVTVSLFFLVFPDEATARFPAATMLPDPALRVRASDAVEKVPGGRGQKLASWLAD